MNQRIFCVSKSYQDVQNGLDKEEVINQFLQAEDLDSIRAAVSSAKDRIYASWASVDVTDRDNEVIPIEDIINQQDILLARNGPITDSHTNKVVGQTLAYKVMRHPVTGTTGVLHLNLIFNHHSLDDKVWEETVTGERQGSSVGGTNEDFTYETDPATGMMRKRLEGFEQYETANVRRGANQWALNEAVSIVAKSAKEVSKDIIEFVNNGQDKEMLRIGIASELSAINLYEDMASKTQDPELKKLFLDIASEEKVHVGEFEQRLTATADPEQAQALQEGSSEAADLAKHTDKAPACENGESVINKFPEGQDNNKGDTMPEDAKNIVSKTEFDEFRNGVTKGLTDLTEAVNKLANKEDGNLPPEKKPEEEPDEDDKPADKKKEVDEEGKDAPEDQRPEEENQQDTFKIKQLAKENAELKKKLAETAKAAAEKARTPRPGAAGNPAGVQKNNIAKTALDIAYGRQRMTNYEVHKMYDEAVKAQRENQFVQ